MEKQTHAFDAIQHTHITSIRNNTVGHPFSIHTSQALGTILLVILQWLYMGSFTLWLVSVWTTRAALVH